MSLIGIIFRLPVITVQTGDDGDDIEGDSQYHIIQRHSDARFSDSMTSH